MRGTSISEASPSPPCAGLLQCSCSDFDAAARQSYCTPYGRRDTNELEGEERETVPVVGAAALAFEDAVSRVTVTSAVPQQWHFTAPVRSLAGSIWVGRGLAWSGSSFAPPSFLSPESDSGGRNESDRGGRNKASSGAAAESARMMLRRVVSDPAAAGDKCGTPDSDSLARSPRSPLDLRAFAALGGSLLRSPRSPRSWDSQRVGLGGLVDTLAEPAADAKNRLLGFQMRPTKLQCFAKSYTSLPKDCGNGQPELGEVKAAPAAAGAGGMSVPCTRFYRDVKSGPEVIMSGGSRLGFSSHSVDLGKFPASGSLPVSIGGPRRYIGSVSAMEVEQSEDYTCIIAHGSNPKTTRIFGDCILEPCPLLVPDWESKETEEAELYWLVKGPGDADEEFMRFCLTCKKNLDGDESCIYRGENAFCSVSCKNKVTLNEEEEDTNPTVSSPSSASSTMPFHEDDIFIDGVVSGRADKTSVCTDA